MEWNVCSVSYSNQEQINLSQFDLAVSGTHARLEKKDGRLLVTDLGSTNGTYINERRLNPGFAIPIDPGSLLIFGLHQ